MLPGNGETAGEAWSRAGDCGAGGAVKMEENQN